LQLTLALLIGIVG
jgi:hypothetical protein